MGAFAWVTLATNDSYSLGALVLAHSLKQAGTAHQLAVLVTPGVTSAMREKLAAVFNVVQEVNILDSRDEANLRLLKRPELGITFTKLHCWRLTQFEKCVFLDADTLVLQNSDELFEREELSAAPDVGWPDCFNSGVFVYRPSLDTYEKLIQFTLEKGSFDGGDQGLLNLYFSDWAHKDISKHLPFIYNMCSTACYSYLPAFKQFGANAKIIHFIGPQKPWLQYFNTETKKVQPSGDSSHLQEVLQRWWDIFCSLIHPHLSPAMQGQSQHGISPSYVPPQYHPPTNPTASADDYENTWDPWDEYDQKVAQNAHHTLISTHYNQNQSIESLNTNASRVANQPSIHSQPQPHNYNTNSVQNNSYYQPSPPQVVYHNIPRVPTPPATPRPQYYHQPPEFHHHQPPETRHFHSESHQQHSEPQYYHEQQSSQEHNNEHQYDQNRHSDPQVYHNESQSHQEYNREQRHDQYHHSEPQFYHNEPHSYQEHQHSEQYHFDAQTESHEQIDYSSEESHKKDGHVQTYPSFSHTPERPGSPNRPDQIPVLPKECEATTTVSNDMSLSSTIEDSSKHEDAGLAGAFSQLTLGVARTPEQDALENILRKQAWEVGNIDYLGRDSFENIWSKITETLSFGAPQPEASAPAPEQEVPSAPAESQSQTAPQEEAIPVQTPVLPLDTSTPKIDSIESSPSVEVQKDDEPKLEVSVDTSTKEGTTEETKPVSSSEVAPADVIKEVVTSPEPKSEVSQGLIEKEPPTESAATPVTEPATAPVEPAATPVPEPAVAPSTEPAAEPLPTPTAAPVTQSVSAAVTESIALPLTEPVAKPVTEPAAAPVTGIVAAPVAEPPAALVVETAQPVAEPVAAKAVTEPVAEPLSCPIPPKKDAQEKPSSEPQPIPAQAVAPESVVSQSIATQESPQVSPQSVQTKPASLKEPVAESQSPAAPVDPSVGSTEPAVAPTPSSPSAAEPSAADLELSAEPAVTTPAADISKPTESSVPTKSSPKTKVTEATPPATPATPPVEKTKSALTAEATVPDTPPPSEGGSTPTPPPRKTDKPKKAAAKQKK